MSNLALHSLTERQLAAFRQVPAHALILTGPTGSGKLSLARQLAESILDLPPDSFVNYGYGLIIAPVDGKAIGIELIRQLEHFLSLKVPLQNDYNRAVIIADSHLLTIEAQNALLKTLEEPPDGTIIILTASQEKALLPTVRSRAVTMNVRRPERAALEAHFAKTQDFDRAYVLSAGLPGLINALLTDEEHPLKTATVQAREFLSQPTYMRLGAVDELSKQRAQAINVLFVLQNMAHLSLQTATGLTAKRWQRILQAAYYTQAALLSNAQPKLALTQLMLQL